MDPVRIVDLLQRNETERLDIEYYEVDNMAIVGSMKQIVRFVLLGPIQAFESHVRN